MEGPVQLAPDKLGLAATACGWVPTKKWRGSANVQAVPSKVVLVSHTSGLASTNPGCTSSKSGLAATTCGWLWTNSGPGSANIQAFPCKLGLASHRLGLASANLGWTSVDTGLASNMCWLCPAKPCNRAGDVPTVSRRQGDNGPARLGRAVPTVAVEMDGFLRRGVAHLGHRHAY